MKFLCVRTSLRLITHAHTRRSEVCCAHHSLRARPPALLVAMAATRATNEPQTDGRHQSVHFMVPENMQCAQSWQDRAVRMSNSTMSQALYHCNSRALLGGAGSDVNLILTILRDHAFAPAEGLSSPWTIFWHTGDFTSAELQALGSLQPHQRWNKLPGASAITVKTNLCRILRAAQKKHGKEHFAFVPDSFVLPDEIADYEALMRAEVEEENVWILKPGSLQRGTGIFLHRASEQRHGWGGCVHELMPNAVRYHKGVASRYIHPPLLIGEHKFDMRIYVLVTCTHPLVAYVYDEGLTRFATSPFDTDDLQDRCKHLTNYSLNKHAKGFLPNTAAEEEDAAEADGVGSKWSLTALRRWLRGKLGEQDEARLLRDIDAIIAKTLVAAEPAMFEALYTSAHPTVAKEAPCQNFFQLFGFDVMLDAEVRPWLLEVNAGPSLATEAPLDLRIKSKMLVDLLNVIGISAAVPEAADSQGAVSLAAASAAATEPILWKCSNEPVQERWARRLVAEEAARAATTAWRRLLPSPEYAPLLEAGRTLHHLDYERGDGGIGECVSM